MTWTYDPTLPSDKDTVRFLVSDTNTDDQLVTDEAIAALLERFGSVYDAGAAIADSLAGKFARASSISIDGLSIRSSDRAADYRALATSLRQQGLAAAGGLGEPFVGGLSRDAMEGVESDEDRAANLGIRERLFDNPPIDTARES